MQKTPTIKVSPNLDPSGHVRMLMIMVQCYRLPIQIHLQNAGILHKNHGFQEAVLSRYACEFPQERVSKRKLPQHCYSLQKQ